MQSVFLAKAGPHLLGYVSIGHYGVREGEIIPSGYVLGLNRTIALYSFYLGRIPSSNTGYVV